MEQAATTPLAPELEPLHLPAVTGVKPKGRRTKKPLTPPNGLPAKRGRPSIVEKYLPTILTLAGQYGWSYRQIAEYLSKRRGQSVSGESVRAALYRLRKGGALADTEAKLTHMAVPVAVESLIELLSKGNKEAVIETLKGVGLFRQFQSIKQEGAPSKMELVVTFQRPEGESREIVEGSIVGTPLGLGAGTCQ